MAREQSQAQDTGRLGYLGPQEPWDDTGRLRLYYPHAFWADETERMAYQAAVENHPREPDESPYRYIQRLSAIVVGKYEALSKRMPSVWQGRRQRDEELQKLRVQAARAVLGEREDD